MPNLSLMNFRPRKLAKKGDLRNFLDQFWDFILKKTSKINNQMKLEVETILSYWN